MTHDEIERRTKLVSGEGDPPRPLVATVVQNAMGRGATLVEHVDLDEAAGRGDPVKLAHHRGEDVELRADVFQHMFHQHVLEGVARQVPRGLFDFVTRNWSGSHSAEIARR